MGELNGSNLSVAFTCSLPREMISNDNITDDDFWTLNKYNILGQPVPDVVKVLYITFQVVTTGLLMRQLWCKDNETLLHDRGYFNAYLICSITLAITVFLFGFLFIFTGDFVYGASDTTRCNLCAAAGFFFILVNTLALHCYACWYFSTMIILVFIYKRRTSRATFRQWLENTSRITFRIKFPLLAVVVAVCIGMAVAPLAGFGQYEFDRDLGLCVPRATGINHRSGIRNKAYITFLAVESLVPIAVCAILFFVHLYSALTLRTHRTTRKLATFFKLSVYPRYAFGFGFGTLWWLVSIAIMLSLTSETSSQQSFVYCWLFYMMSYVVQNMSVLYVLH